VFLLTVKTFRNNLLAFEEFFNQNRKSKMNTESSKSLAPLPDWEPPTRIELFRNEWCSDHVGHSGPSAVIVHSGKSLSHDNLLEKVYNVIKYPHICVDHL